MTGGGSKPGKLGSANEVAKECKAAPAVVNEYSVTRVFLMTSEGIRCCEVRIGKIEIRGTQYRKLAAKYFGQTPANMRTSHSSLSRAATRPGPANYRFPFTQLGLSGDVTPSTERSEWSLAYQNGQRYRRRRDMPEYSRWPPSAASAGGR